MGDKKKNKTGRPPFTVNWTRVDELLKYGANGVQVAASLGIHYDTLVNALHREKPDYPTFSAYIQEKRSIGDALLLESMYKNAVENEDKTMQVWLSKNRLGYTDKQEVKSENTVKFREININPASTKNESND